MKNELKELTNPKRYHDPISIENQDIGELKNMKMDYLTREINILYLNHH